MFVLLVINNLFRWGSTLKFLVNASFRWHSDMEASKQHDGKISMHGQSITSRLQKKMNVSAIMKCSGFFFAQNWQNVEIYDLQSD